tara:strand:+ start:1848 stop:2129 length:282 start_codon:yes stop_codon:yes gene_type:complete
MNELPHKAYLAGIKKGRQNLQSSYNKKDELYNHILGRLSGVMAGSPRQLKYKDIVFCNLKAKREWIKMQERSLQKLCDVMKRLSKRIHVSQAA